jgi:DNA-binding beta-propeller fold protein YncE
MTMRPRIKSKTVAAVFATMTLLSVSLVLTPARPAEQPSLLYATAEAGTKLIAISLEAMTVRVIGDTGFPFSLGLAFCPPGGVPYTISNTFDPSNAQLARLNLGTGAATLVGSPLGQNLAIMGMTCSPDGTLYAIGQFNPLDPAFNSLYTVDRETGQASRIGSTGAAKFLMALAFTPDGTTLYGASVSALYQINPLTGAATKVVDFSGVSSVMGLAIDSDGNFYVSDFVADSHIYLLNVGTGAATPILDTGLSHVHNIAFKAPA